MNYKDTKLFLQNNQFNPSKKMGQNFLIDENIQKELINKLNLQKDDYILEIGPGLGAITKYLYNISNHLILIELDKRLYAFLKTAYPLLDIINNDILKVDLNILEQKYHFTNLKVVSNIPYHISSKIILMLIKYPFINQINLLVQTEMAQHLYAKVNEHNYNSFSILVGFYFKTKMIMKVPATCFLPQPEVESTFIQLTRYHTYDNVNFEKLSQLLKISFSFKRKTLINNLTTKYDKRVIIDFLNRANLALNIRPQALSIEHYYELYKYLYE